MTAYALQSTAPEIKAVPETMTAAFDDFMEAFEAFKETNDRRLGEIEKQADGRCRHPRQDGPHQPRDGRAEAADRPAGAEEGAAGARARSGEASLEADRAQGGLRKLYSPRRRAGAARAGGQGDFDRLGAATAAIWCRTRRIPRSAAGFRWSRRSGRWRRCGRFPARC